MVFKSAYNKALVRRCSQSLRILLNHTEFYLKIIIIFHVIHKSAAERYPTAGDGAVDREHSREPIKRLQVCVFVAHFNNYNTQSNTLNYNIRTRLLCDARVHTRARTRMSSLRNDENNILTVIR